jgi:hypothetical protein
MITRTSGRREQKTDSFPEMIISQKPDAGSAILEQLLALEVQRVNARERRNPEAPSQSEADGEGCMHAMNSLKFHLGPHCPTLLHHVRDPPLKRPYRRFRGGLPARQAACGHPTPLDTPRRTPLPALQFAATKLMRFFLLVSL